jgi:transcriptional regulator with GAF, ATPase, and Fis domain
MSNIPKVSLEDTYTLLQLMRETALIKGRQAQAEKLNPVTEQMRSLVQNSRKADQASAPLTQPPSGILAQPDFQQLLEVSKNRPLTQPPSSTSGDPAERNRMIAAMAAAQMSEVDIARQLGMTREEVRLVLSVQQRSNPKVNGGYVR